MNSIFPTSKILNYVSPNKFLETRFAQVVAAGKQFRVHIYFTAYNTLGLNPAQKVSAQQVSGHKISKIDNIGQKVSSQNYQNKDNEHYYFSYYIFNSAVGSKANRK